MHVICWQCKARTQPDQMMWIKLKEPEKTTWSMKKKAHRARLNSCTCHIFLCKNCTARSWFFSSYSLHWNQVCFVSMLVLNDISCDMHGSSSMACCIHKCMSMVVRYYCNIYRRKKKHSIFFHHFYCRLLLLLLLPSVVCSIGNEITHTAMFIICGKTLQRSQSFARCSFIESNKKQSAQICDSPALSVCALQMHLRNEIYRFIVDTSHDFCLRAGLCLPYPNQWRKIGTHTHKQHQAHSKNVLGMLCLGFLSVQLCTMRYMWFLIPMQCVAIGKIFGTAPNRFLCCGRFQLTVVWIAVAGCRCYCRLSLCKLIF